MLTKLIIKNFKRFDIAEIELSPPVVFIGPNNSGKTSALQALSLWETGYRKWVEKRGFDKQKQPKERSGITINRKDLTAIPISITKSIWKNLHTHQFNKTSKNNENIYVDIVVEGVDNGQLWTSGFEFYYANEESFYCRPLRLSNEKKPKRMPVPELKNLNIAFLPPMSGLAEQEFHKRQGEIEFLIGQGQTAQVLRNLCYNVYQKFPHRWEEIVAYLYRMFGITLLDPEYSERDEIKIYYEESGKVKLDLSSSGRGVQQVLLLLVYLYANPKSILLLDEPDAHLEILRQREVFNLIQDVAEQNGSQIIAASHSEVVLNETASRGNVVAFIGKPHLMNNKSQLFKALTSIGWDQYYQAEQKAWVLYLEDATDLAILKEFAKLIKHKALPFLENAFVHYISTNLPQKAREHFYGLKEAKPDLKGVAIFDRLDKELDDKGALLEMQWRKREIENYFCYKEVFLDFILEGVSELGLFSEVETKKRTEAMNKAIDDIINANIILGKGDPFSDDFKVSDDFMEPLFRKYSEIMKIPLVLRKNQLFKLVKYVDKDLIDPEIVEKLDNILKVAESAEKKADYEKE